MSGTAGFGSSAASQSAAALGWPREHESAVQSLLRQHWGLSGQLFPLHTSAASRTWQVGGYVAKLARDEALHFTAGLLASEAVDRAGTRTGAPVRTMAGELCVPLPVGRRTRVLAVLRKVDLARLPMRAVPPADLGEFLGGLHRILRSCPTAGAWTPDDVLGHMRRGIMDAHPSSVRQMIEQAVDGVSAYYDTAPPGQLLYGDGPEIFSPGGTDISAIIDWGGVRVGSVADDIGCWTAHGATDQVLLPDYTSAFLEGYGHSNDLAADSAAAVPLFQRLRIASRACYMTASGPLGGVQAWMQHGFAM